MERPRFTAPGRIRRRIAQIATGTAALAGGAVRPHKASLKRLAEMPLTVVAAAVGNYGAFHIWHGWGYLLLTATLVTIERMIADPE
jgi:hypothetical protein